MSRGLPFSSPTQLKGGSCPPPSPERSTGRLGDLQSVVDRLRTDAGRARGSSPGPGPGSARQRDVGPLISRRRLFQGAAGLAAGCACSLCGVRPALAAPWGYGNPMGVTLTHLPPSEWGGTCSTGAQQSPVDVQLAGRAVRTVEPTVNDGLMTAMYSSMPKCSVSNTGHGTMQVSFPPGCRVTVGSKFLELQQFHFHTPSEHAMGGRRFPMEAHLVHKDLYTGEITVLAVMLERGGSGENKCLRLALDCTPDVGEPEVCNQFTTFDPNFLLPKSVREGKKSYVHYQGSLTTPPCTENINWYVFTDSIAVTDGELMDFLEFAGGGLTLGANARPLQPLFDRQFTFYSGL